MAWRIETEPETLDSSDYEKFDEWVLAMSKLPKEFWPDYMLNNNVVSELLLFKFVTTNQLEWHWLDDRNDVILFIPFDLIGDFNKLVKFQTSHDGIECVMKDGYFCYHMDGISEKLDIDLNKIFVE